MAIPTSYTSESFADFLKDEVLRDAADGLGFGDLVPELPQITGKLIIRAGLVGTFGTPPYNYTNGLPIYQPGFSIANGTSLSWSNGVTKTLNAAITPTSTTMDITAGGGGGNFMPGDSATIIFRNAVARVRNPIYESVIEEVLIQLQLADIEDVDATNIRLFRQYGIVELLRKVLQNIAGNYNYAMPIGGVVGANNVYEQVAAMFNREQNRLNRMLAGNITSSSANIPDESLSQSGDTIVVW